MYILLYLIVPLMLVIFIFLLKNIENKFLEDYKYIMYMYIL